MQPVYVIHYRFLNDCKAMLHKVCLAVAMWFNASILHAQYTITPMISLLVEEVASAGNHNLYNSNTRSNNPVLLPLSSQSYKSIPTEVVQQVARWHKEGNERAGKIIGWYANGLQAIVLHTRKSALHGNWQTWHQNGQQRDAGTFVHGMPNGEWKSWYATGKLRSIRQYDAHKLQMVEVAVRQRNPKLAFHTISQEAIKHPEKLKSLLSPGFTLIGSSINSTSYYLPFETCFHDGFFANYFENGIMQQSGFYKDGLKDGLWMQWNADGKMISSGYYFHGTLHGAVKTFNNAGTIQKMTEYKHGKKIFSRNYN